jgi:hypothetical protein
MVFIRRGRRANAASQSVRHPSQVLLEAPSLAAVLKLLPTILCISAFPFSSLLLFLVLALPSYYERRNQPVGHLVLTATRI